MQELKQILRQLIEVFDGLGVPYALMGGLAVRIYGIPRATYDIDFTLTIARESLPSMYKALESHGFTVPQPFHTGWVDSVAGLPLVRIQHFSGQTATEIDVFLAESPYQNELMHRRRQENLNGFSGWLVSPEDLVLLKLIANRPRDISDIADVLFTQGQLDETYMRQWADQLGVRDRLERVLSVAG